MSMLKRHVTPHGGDNEHISVGITQYVEKEETTQGG